MSRSARRIFTPWGIAGTLLVGLTMASPGLAHQPPGPPPQREPLLTPEDRAAMAQVYWHRVQAKLGLTDQQVTDIRALLETQRTAARADFQSLIAAREQLRTQVALRAKLTPDQWQQWHALQGGRGDRWGGGGGFGPGAW